MTPDSLDYFLTGTEQCVSREDLLKKLAAGRPLRVKFGVDPTAPDIHLGHTVPLFKLRQFQDAGHTAVLIIGDFTARIGDPTGRSKTRPSLDAATVQGNARTYEEQAFKILDKSRTEIVHNADWFGSMTLTDTVRLLGRRTVQQMLQRRDFKERYDSQTNISLHELLYPVLQGWDSVMVRADVELGGSDQLFNLLVGRDLQEQEGQPPQVVLTLPLLEGTDGVEKMSKSLGNHIAVTDSPGEMFGKTMRVSDELMRRWSKTLFGADISPETHPMEEKKRLGEKIVARFHDEAAAQQARAEFEKVFSQRELPTDIPVKTVSASLIGIVKLLQETGAVPSGSEARRLIQQGAVSVNDEKITDPKQEITIQGEPVLRCGKRFFAKLKV